MAQLRGRLCLPQEAHLDCALKRQLGRKDLDRDVALETLVARAIYDAHPAAANLTVQLVVSAQDPFDVRAELGARR